MSVIMWDWIFFALYAILVIGCVVVVLKENRNPIRSLAWIVALIALPYVGLIFYFFFGRSLKGMHMLSRHNKRKIFHNRKYHHVNLKEAPISSSDKALVRLASSLCQSQLTFNNDVHIFTTGQEKFRKLINDLEGASKSIYLQYYIFQDDEIGNLVADILMRKAREGVDVKVIYDNVGSFSTSNRFFKKMRESGVNIHPFFKVTFPHLANRINWRNHRKIVVVDNRIGYIGGMNIADRYALDHSGEIAWRDTHLRVEGEIVEPLLYSFAIDWNFLKKSPELLPMRQEKNRISNEVGIQLVTSGPVENFDNIALVFLKAISMAQKSIYIQTPYFLPTDTLLHALEAAALAKIDVRIMIPKQCDSKMLRYASFSYVTQCLRAGIKVYLYTPGMLHAKTMIVDDEFVTAGSTNFDFRSFENNFECNLLIYNKGINDRMRDIFFEDLKHCRKLTLSTWKKRSIGQRFMESLVRLVAPIL